MKNDRGRKVQLTINNPLEYGYTHERIREIMEKFKTLYYCLCDEVGENGTPHTHIYFVCENAVNFDTVKKRFPHAHIEFAHGSNRENRDYIRKEGKHEDKSETNKIETFEEYGDLPLDRAEKNKSISEQVYQMIVDGYTDAEIIKEFPSYMTKVNYLEQARQIILAEKNNNIFRNVDVTYIYGQTGTGKTRHVMDSYGYTNVHKTTNYEHPFDSYRGEDVVLFDEFRSSLPIGDMLQYIDGYPCRLPARYSDKSACFTKVFIVSNIPLSEQYKNIQTEQPETWNAFLRRIKTIIRFEVNNGQFPFCDIGEIVQTEELIEDLIKGGYNV